VNIRYGPSAQAPNERRPDAAATIARYDKRHSLLAGSFSDPRTDFACVQARSADLSDARFGAALVSWLHR